MQTICLFTEDYDSRDSLHRALKLLLSLPDYYGGNADALNDCLSERPVCPALWIHLGGNEEVRQAAAIVMRVFQDNNGLVKEL